MIKVNITNYKSNLSAQQVINNKGIYGIGNYNSDRFVNNGSSIIEFTKNTTTIIVYEYDDFLDSYNGSEFIKLNEKLEINFIKDSNEN